MRGIEQGLGEGAQGSTPSLGTPAVQNLDVFTNPDACSPNPII